MPLDKLSTADKGSEEIAPLKIGRESLKEDLEAPVSLGCKVAQPGAGVPATATAHAFINGEVSVYPAGRCIDVKTFRVQNSLATFVVFTRLCSTDYRLTGQRQGPTLITNNKAGTLNLPLDDVRAGVQSVIISDATLINGLFGPLFSGRLISDRPALNCKLTGC